MIIVVGLIIAFVLILLFARPDMRACRWRRVGPPDSQGKTLYKCAACGARVFTSDGKPLLDCMVNPRE
jgi:hypothetical protein